MNAQNTLYHFTRVVDEEFHEFRKRAEFLKIQENQSRLRKLTSV